MPASRSTRSPRATSARRRRCRRSSSRRRSAAVARGCDGTYGCSYSRTISFRTPTTPLPMEADPGKGVREDFRPRQHGRGARGDRERLHERARHGHGEVAHLERGLGAEDRAMVSDYLDSVREIERRMQLLERTRPVGRRRAGQSRRSAGLRRAPAADVRPARGRLSDEHDAHRDVHDGGRGQQHVVCARRRAGRVPSAVAPCGEQARRWRSSRIVQRYHSEVFAGFLDEARGHCRTATRARCSTTRYSCTAAT